MAEKADHKKAQSESRPEDRREWQRILIDLEVDYGNEENYLFAYIRDLSATGIFVRTNTPEDAGTRINLRFTPPDGSGEPLELEGEVIWVNPVRPGHSDNLHPGMGIRFVGIEDEHRHRLVEYIKTFAYLDDEDDSSGSSGGGGGSENDNSNEN